MTNPFDAPANTPSGPGKVIDVGRALSDGMEAAQRNLLSGSLAVFLAILAYYASVLACVVPVLVVAPALMWGMMKFSFEALDGEATVGTMFSGFSNIGDYWMSVMGAFLAIMGAVLAIEIPLIAIVAWTESSLLGLLMIPVGLAFIALIIVGQARIMFTFYLIVDQRLPALEAITRSWELTAASTLPLIGLILANGIVMIIGALLCGVGVLPAAVLAMTAQASAYRQAIGAR